MLWEITTIQGSCDEFLNTVTESHTWFVVVYPSKLGRKPVGKSAGRTNDPARKTDCNEFRFIHWTLYLLEHLEEYLESAKVNPETDLSKKAFEKRNFKSNAVIAQHQKKLDKYQKALKVRGCKQTWSSWWMAVIVTEDFSRLTDIFIIFRTWIPTSKEQGLTLPRRSSGTAAYHMTYGG
jgi:hypothetical protein